MENKLNICPLCKREIPKKLETDHHLFTKLRGDRNGEKVPMHKICHSKIHSLFSENMIAKELNSIEKLLENEDIRKFVKWVQKQPIDFDYSNKMSNKRKRR